MNWFQSIFGRRRRVHGEIPTSAESGERQGVPAGIQLARELADGGRFRSALKVYQQLLEDAPSFTAKVTAAVNLGITYWVWIGDGERAREWFLRPLEAVLKEHAYGELRPAARQAAAYSAENLMVLALSYDEYFKRADQLKQFAPEEEILRRGVPHVERMQEEGLSWGDVMFGSTNNYYSADSTKDLGRWGCAASIFQLMLKHRRQVRLTAEVHRSSLIGYTALLIMMWAKYGESQGNQEGPVAADEIRFILEPAKTELDEFLARNPDDERIRKCLGDLQRCLDAGDHAPSGSGVVGATDAAMQHFQLAREKVGGVDCRLSLVNIELDGPNVVLYYRWENALDEMEADRVDTRARARLNVSVGEAAAMAGIPCSLGPNDHYLRLPGDFPNLIPGWYLADRTQPTYVVNSQFDMSSQTIRFTIGTPILNVSELSFELGNSMTSQLAETYSKHFRELDV